MKILNKLTIKHLLMNKKRTIVTIIGVILSTSLMVGIGLIVSSFRDSLIRDAELFNGKQHVIFRNINEEQSKIIENNVKIKSYLKMSFFDSFILDDKEYQIYNIDIDNLNKIKKDGEITNNNDVIIPKNLKNTFSNQIEVNDKKYNVVGTIDDVTNIGLSNGFNHFLFTTNNETNYNLYFIKFKDVKNAHKYIEELVNELNLNIEDVDINTELLAYNGSVKYSNIMDTLYKIIIIVLALISIGCIIVIYNSFAISVMERKKQFGLFSSIGTTKSQLIKTVYFEAIIISLIGIPIGILASYLGIGIVIKITNSLLNLGTNLLELTTYPLFIIIPIIFMVITILVSAFLPALKASKVSPIEAIRMNDDIKIKGKKVKTPKFITKLFGIEGALALKNIKRNKKKYRVTIISLFISIVLFITFSSFINYVIGGVKYMSSTPDFDVDISGDIGEKNRNEIINSDFVNEYLDVIEIPFRYNDKHAMIYLIDDKTYNKALNKIGKTDKKPIVANNYNKIEYSGNSRTVRISKKFKKVEKITLEYDKEILEFDDYYLVDDFGNLLDSFISEDVYLIMTKDMLKDYNKYQNDYDLLIKSDKYNELTNYAIDLLELDKENPHDYDRGISVYNIAEEFRLQKNIIIVIKIFVYGFIALVTLIGVTSVINTINTSIALRRKEFAILRSIGLTKKGFNKMIYFESLFFGLKSLLYALPVSGVIIYFIHTSITDVLAYQSVMLPIMQMIYAIIGVFVIVLLTMLYASRKIKKENILEAIREENI